VRPSVCQYDLMCYDFGSILRDIYAVEDLSALVSKVPLERLTWQTDQQTEFHASFYQAFEPRIKDLYRAFVADFVPTILGTEDFCFQRVPTFRLHFPGNIAVGEFHTDGDYNHEAGEVNFWVPFTAAWDTNSVWIETELGNSDYQPWELSPGQALVFDAVHWRHGNKVNDTGSTRVSFDFRCIRMADYAPSEKRTVDAKRGLWIGEYYDVL
jgi:hypothetical protein